MTLNIGNDVWGGLLDFIIPWNWVSLLNSLKAIFGKSLGKKYGVLLYDREEESGWSESREIIWNKEFGTKSEALQRCLFLAKTMWKTQEH